MQRVVAEVGIEFCKASAKRGVNKLAEGAVEASVKESERYRKQFLIKSATSLSTKW